MPGQGRSKRQRVAALDRRLDYLRDLVANGTANSYDRSEIAALEWAVPLLAARVAAETPNRRERRMPTQAKEPTVILLFNSDPGTDAIEPFEACALTEKGEVVTAPVVVGGGVIHAHGHWYAMYDGELVAFPRLARDEPDVPPVAPTNDEQAEGWYSPEDLSEAEAQELVAALTHRLRFAWEDGSLADPRGAGGEDGYAALLKALRTAEANAKMVGLEIRRVAD